MYVHIYLFLIHIHIDMADPTPSLEPPRPESNGSVNSVEPIPEHSGLQALLGSPRGLLKKGLKPKICIYRYIHI